MDDETTTLLVLAAVAIAVVLWLRRRTTTVPATTTSQPATMTDAQRNSPANVALYKGQVGTATTPRIAALPTGWTEPGTYVPATRAQRAGLVPYTLTVSGVRRVDPNAPDIQPAGAPTVLQALTYGIL